MIARSSLDALFWFFMVKTRAFLINLLWSKEYSHIFLLEINVQMLLHAKSKICNASEHSVICKIALYINCFIIQTTWVTTTNKYLQLQHKVKSALPQRINWIHNESDDDVNAVWLMPGYACLQRMKYTIYDPKQSLRYIENTYFCIIINNARNKFTYDTKSKTFSMWKKICSIFPTSMDVSIPAYHGLVINYYIEVHLKKLEYYEKGQYFLSLISESETHII